MRQTSMFLAALRPSFPESERTQNHALDWVATDIGYAVLLGKLYLIYLTEISLCLTRFLSILVFSSHLGIFQNNAVVQMVFRKWLQT
jgi:hypothetical protein